MVDTDVVVVGGGLAGLRCGWRLAEAGRSVVVVEEAEVRRQVGEVYGLDATRWWLLHRHDIRYALPAQPPPLRTTSPAQVSPSVYVCGDHRDTASIPGSLVSGHCVAGAVLADLASA